MARSSASGRTPPLLLLLLAMATTVASYNITAANLTLTTDGTAVLALTLVPAPTALANVSAAEWSRLWLQEGWAAATALTLAGLPSLSLSDPSVVLLPLVHDTHRTTSLPVPYTLACAADALGPALQQGAPLADPTCASAVEAESTNTSLTVTVSRAPAPSTPQGILDAEASFRARRQGRTCRTFRGVVATSITIATLADAQALARLACTAWAGSLRVHSLALSNAEWYAVLASLDEVEGGLAVVNAAGFGLRHVAHVRALASGRARAAKTGRVLVTADDGVRLTQPSAFEALAVINATGFAVDGALGHMVDAVVAGRGAVRVLQTTPAPCLIESETRGWWWAQPGLVELEYNTSTCAALPNSTASCPLYTAGSDVCVSSCVGCGARCEGGVVSTRADLADLAGPATQTPCAYVRGGLILSGLLDVDEQHLAPLRTITAIETLLYVAHNQWLLTLDVLSNLSEVPRVAIEGNAALVDARLPALNPSVASVAVVLRNTRLCDAGLPTAPLGGRGCGRVRLEGDYTTPFLTQRVLESFTATKGIRDVLLALLQPHAPSLTGSDISTALRLGPILRLSLDVPLNESTATLDALRTAGADGSLRTGLTSLGSTGLAFADLAPAGTPRRRPAPGSESSGLVLSLTRHSDTLQLEWAAPPGATNATRYVLDFGITAATRTSLALTSYLLSGATDTGELALPALPANSTLVARDTYELARVQASAGLGQLFSFTTLSVSLAEMALELPACTRVRSGVLVQQPPSAGCLIAGQLYRLRLRAYTFGDTLISNEVEAQLTDESLSVPSIAVTPEEEALFVSWTPPMATETLYSYEVQLRYATAHNTLAVEDGGESDTLTAELLSLSTRNRIQVHSTSTSLRLAGCFHDQARNTSHCIAPFTAYHVAVRAVGSEGPGLLRSTLSATLPVAPRTPPRLVSMTTPTATTLESRLTLQRPDVVTAVVAAFRLAWTGSQGQVGELLTTVPEPRLQQRQNPDQAFDIVLRALDPYTTYTLNVTVVTNEGTEGTPLPLTITTPAVAPAQLDPPLLVPQDDGTTVHVSWIAPQPKPGNITAYELRANFISSAAPGDLLYAGLDTSIVVPLESVGPQSDLRLRVVTAEFGASAWSVDPLQADSDNDSGLLSMLTHPGVLAGICGAVVLIAILLVVRRVRRRVRRYKMAEEAALLAAPQLDRWEVRRDQLVLGRKLGEGAFGEVFQAVATNLPTVAAQTGSVTVAVKLCTGRELTDRTSFVKEAMLMKTFADPFHPNVLRLLAVVTETEPMMIVTEFMARGDLRAMLLKARPTESEGGEGKETLTVTQLLRMAADVAAGMAFLADHKFVHRDLACRNCLVAEDLTCKVADFGLSRTLNYSEYYRKSGQALLPVRWMDPVSLTTGKFDVATDVWSFGIVLYEIFQFGKIPYPGMSNREVFERVVDGYRMAQPAGCPDAVYELMVACWETSARPSFHDLDKRLQEIMEIASTVHLAGAGGLSGNDADGVPAADAVLPAAQLRQLLRTGQAPAVDESEYLIPVVGAANSAQSTGSDTGISNGTASTLPTGYCDMHIANTAASTAAASPLTPVAATENYCDMTDAHLPIARRNSLEWDQTDLPTEAPSPLGKRRQAPPPPVGLGAYLSMAPGGQPPAPANSSSAQPVATKLGAKPVVRPVVQPLVEPAEGYEPVVLPDGGAKLMAMAAALEGKRKSKEPRMGSDNAVWA